MISQGYIDFAIEKIIQPGSGGMGGTTNAYWPYRAALIQAMINKARVSDELFNKWFQLKDIVHDWRKISSSYVSDRYKGQKHLISDETAIRYIIDYPAKKMANFNHHNSLFELDKEKRSVRINLYELGKSNEVFLFLKMAAKVGLIKVNGSASKNDLKLLNSKELLYMNLLTESAKKTNSNRKGQRKFRVELFEKHGESCAFCGHNFNVQAAHIKPWVLCDFHEEFNVDNGVPLCPNCHAAFDAKSIFVDGLTICRELKYSLSIEQYFKHDSIVKCLPARYSDSASFFEWNKKWQKL